LYRRKLLQSLICRFCVGLFFGGTFFEICLLWAEFSLYLHITMQSNFLHRKTNDPLYKNWPLNLKRLQIFQDTGNSSSPKKSNVKPQKRIFNLAFFHDVFSAKISSNKKILTDLCPNWMAKQYFIFKLRFPKENIFKFFSMCHLVRKFWLKFTLSFWLTQKTKLAIVERTSMLLNIVLKKTFTLLSSTYLKN